MRLSYEPFTLELPTPLRTARGVIGSRQGFVVRVEHEGLVGLGEACCAEELGTESPNACVRSLAQSEEFVSAAGLVESIESISEFPPLGSLGPAARHGVELAWLDVLAQSRGIPLGRLLHEEMRPVVELSALVFEGAAEAERLAAAGYRTLKLKVGAAALQEDAQRLFRVRQTVGESVQLRIDANGAWSEPQALVALRGLSPLRLALCEQPVPANCLQGLRRIRRARVCAIAADESLTHAQRRDGVLDDGDGPAADVLVLKPMLLGGLLPALALARRAHALGVGAYVTTSIDGTIARAGAMHLAAALPAADWSSGVFLRDGRDPWPVIEGRVAIPSRPGLGVSA